MYETKFNDLVLKKVVSKAIALTLKYLLLFNDGGEKPALNLPVHYMFNLDILNHSLPHYTRTRPHFRGNYKTFVHLTCTFILETFL